SYFRSANQEARVFAWPQKIPIRLKSQSVINTGNDRTPAEAKNSAQYKPKVQYQRQHRVAQIRQRPEGLTTQHQPGVAMNKKVSLFFLHLERGAGHVGGGDFTGCKNSHGNDGRRPAEFMSRSNAASQLGNALLESSDKLRSRRFPPRQVIWLIALGLLALPTTAHASMFHGETLDTVAGVI